MYSSYLSPEPLEAVICDDGVGALMAQALSNSDKTTAASNAGNRTLIGEIIQGQRNFSAVEKPLREVEIN